jgi:hypothetical protein
VVLKWYLDDEEYGPKAMNLLTRYITDELDILAPSLLEYEVVNGLIIAQNLPPFGLRCQLYGCG